MNSVLATILVPAVGGLVFAAYRHPDVYRRLWPVLGGLVCAVYVLVVAYDLGAMHAGTALDPFLDPSKLLEARAAQEAVGKYGGVGFLYTILAQFLLAILSVFEQLGLVSEKYLEERRKAVEVAADPHA